MTIANRKNFSPGRTPLFTSEVEDRKDAILIQHTETYYFKFVVRTLVCKRYSQTVPLD